MDGNHLKTAASYLLVLQNLEQLEDDKGAVRLLNRAYDAEDWQLCKELLRFLHSIDDSGDALRDALAQADFMLSADVRMTMNGSHAYDTSTRGVS